MEDETFPVSGTSRSSSCSPHQDFGGLENDPLISDDFDSEVPPSEVHLSGNS